MKLSRISAALIALAGFGGTAQAQNFSAITAPGFTTETTTLAGQYLTPLTQAGQTISSYSVLSTAAGFATSATLSFTSPVTSFSFLWGSPDGFNSVSDGKVAVTGSMVSSGTGNNAETLLYTFSDLAGFSALTFSTGGVAFEVAQVTAVPEPGTMVLMFSGVSALLFMVWRRKSD